MKTLRLSALSNGHLYPTVNILGTHFCVEEESIPGSECGRKGLSMKNFNETIGNQTHYLLACNAMPQPTALYGVEPKTKANKTQARKYLITKCYC